MAFVYKINCFQFQNNFIVNKKVHTISLVKLHIIPKDREINLTFYLVAIDFKQIFKCIWGFFII